MKNNYRRGFTIIETTIVMAFVALLALSVVFVSVYIGKMYAKGVTLKALNQVGRDVSDMMRRDVSVSKPQSVVYIPGGGAEHVGRLCLGEVSYIWNNAGLLRNPSASVPKFKLPNGRPGHLVRVVDASSRYCNQVSGSYPMQVASTETYTELLMNADNEMAIYSFAVSQFHNGGGATPVTEGLYNIKFGLGTNQTDTTILNVDGSTTCKPPSDNAANFDYCSVREFDVLMRAGGERT